MEKSKLWLTLEVVGRERSDGEGDAEGFGVTDALFLDLGGSYMGSKFLFFLHFLVCAGFHKKKGLMKELHDTRIQYIQINID